MESIANDFSDIASMYSIGKSYEGRDINVLEIKTSSGGSSEEAKPKEKATKEESSSKSKDEETLV